MRAALIAAMLAAAGPAARAAEAHRVELVACAPGYPGTTAEAQPNMDALAAAVTRAARWREGSVTALYEPTEKGGLARLKAGASVALVPLPFYAKHAAALKLAPRLATARQDAPEATEIWTLVARRGRIPGPAALSGFTISSSAGYSPGFVRAVLAGWGRLPADVRIVESAQVLSALRKSASGENQAVLLDGTQSAALPSLPFAGELEVVARSSALPSGLVVTIGDRLPAARWRTLERALGALPASPDGAAALQGLSIVRFVPLDGGALAAARRLAAEAAR